MKKVFLLCATFITFTAGNGNALVLKGLDSLTTYQDAKYLIGRSKVSYDFVNQVACTSYTSYSGCNNSFELEQNVNINVWTYNLSSPPNGAQAGGYGVNMGIINLDSLRTAPADSIFNKNYVTFDAIPVSPDSILSRVGCSYWIKTGPDPQYQNRVLFAKLRILSLKVLDSANHKASMQFLYACDINGSRTITTSNFDTFFRTPTPVFSSGSSRSAAIRSSPGIYRVFGDRFVIPKEFAGKASTAEVYALSGRRLGAIAVEKSATGIDLRPIAGARELVIVHLKTSEP